jgi:hypothetical protein
MNARTLPLVSVLCLITSGCADRLPLAPTASTSTPVALEGTQATAPSRSSTALPATVASAKATLPPPSEVRRFSDNSVVAGAQSTLMRNDNGVRMTVHTSDLDPGAAYTVWWVIFNNPAACGVACMEDDLGNPAVEASVVFAAGHVLPPTGRGNFAAHIQVGDTTGALFGPGLQNPRTAEIHLVMRSHGAPIPGLVHEQISSFGGGCGVNVCEDRQFAVHMP